MRISTSNCCKVTRVHYVQPKQQMYVIYKYLCIISKTPEGTILVTQCSMVYRENAQPKDLHYTQTNQNNIKYKFQQLITVAAIV